MVRSRSSSAAESDEGFTPRERTVSEGLTYELAVLNERKWMDEQQQVAEKAKSELTTFMERVKQVHSDINDHVSTKHR